MGENKRTSLGALCILTKGTYATEKTPPGPYPLMVTAESPRTADSFQLEGEAVCIPIVSSTGHGHASLKRVHYARGKFAVANLLVAAQPRPDAPVDTRWLWLYLNHFKDRLIVPLMRGTANVSLKPTQLLDIPIDLPPLAEQRRIVDVLVALDQMGDALRTQYSAALNALGAFLTDSLAGVQGERLPLAKVLTLSVGGDWGADVGADEVDLPVYRQTEFTELGLLARPANATRSFSVRRVESRRLRPDDILMQKSAGSPSLPGRVVRCPPDIEEAVLSNFLHLLRVAPHRAEPSFVFWYLWRSHWVGEALDYQAGTNIRNLNVPRYMQREIVLPEPAVQRRIAGAADSIQNLLIGVLDAQQALTRLRTAVLPELLTGAHEIPESYDRLLDVVA